MYLRKYQDKKGILIYIFLSIISYVCNNENKSPSCHTTITKIKVRKTKKE